MSGYYNTLKFDSCNNDFQAYTGQAVSDYVLNINAAYRPGEMPTNLSIGSQPTTYGPLRGALVTQESFLQGRGQTLADCPDCDVRWLPESLFPTPNAHNRLSSCQRTDLEPLQTRTKRSCNGLEEMDTSAYWMMPGAWQPSYSGPNHGVGGNLQTRQAPYDPSINQGGEFYGGGGGCNYGTYGSGRNMAPYSL